MSKQIYEDIKVNSMSFNEKEKNREGLIAEHHNLISSKEFDINEVLMDHDGIYRYITPLAYLLLVDDAYSSK